MRKTVHLIVIRMGAAHEEQQLAVGVGKVDVGLDRIREDGVARQHDRRGHPLVEVGAEVRVGELGRLLGVVLKQTVTVLLEVLAGERQQNRAQNRDAQKDDRGDGDEVFTEERFLHT